MAIEVPLFPLGSVLFPHMPMSLHIFEERYKAMMRDCRRESTTFGIVAIRSGQETGGSAVPYEVGTLAQLDAGMLLYDSFYRWSRDAVGETHSSPGNRGRRPR